MAVNKKTYTWLLLLYLATVVGLAWWMRLPPAPPAPYPTNQSGEVTQQAHERVIAALNPPEPGSMTCDNCFYWEEECECR